MQQCVVDNIDMFSHSEHAWAAGRLKKDIILQPSPTGMCPALTPNSAIQWAEQDDAIHTHIFCT